MEVTHISDYDTHAIMGGGKAKKFGVVQTAEFITVLSSTLYSDGPLALVREVTCNAWDAHKITNQRNVPVQITLDAEKLCIRDFGPGIDPRKMEDIYCTYGASTKKAQVDQTGGFGLGSKSPFAYTDYFMVTVFFEGKKTVWAISRGSDDGMPEAIPMVTTNTTESGVLVEIPLQNVSDQDKFYKIVRQVVGFGGINASLNGNIISTLPLDNTREGILFTSAKPATLSGLLYIRYGNVVYPIPQHREYEHLYDAATGIMKKTGTNFRYGYEYNAESPMIAIFDAEPNTISVTPSRESLHTSDRTINTVKELLTKFLTLTQKSGGQDMIRKEEDKIMDWWFDPKNKQDGRDVLLSKNLIFDYYNNKKQKWFIKSENKLSVEELLLSLAADGHFYNEGDILSNLRTNRLNKLIQKETIDTDLLIKLRGILKENPTMWDGSFADRPDKVRFSKVLSRSAAMGLNPKNLIMWDRSGYRGRKAYSGKPLAEAQDTLENLIKVSRRVIMIVDGKGQIDNHSYTALHSDMEFIHHSGCLAYVMSIRKHPSLEETKKIFRKQGYVVIDVAGYYREQARKLEEERKALAEAGKLDVLVEEPKVVKPKNHYLSMQNLSEASGKEDYTLFKDKGFYPRNYLDRFDKQKIWIDNPEYVFKPNKIKRNHCDSRFFTFCDRAGEEIISLFGSRGAIAVNSKQYEKMVSNGVVDGEDWLVTQVTNEIMNNNLYADVIAYEEFFEQHGRINSRTYNKIKTLSASGAHLPDIVIMTKESNKYLTILDQLDTYKSFLTPNNREKIISASKYLNDIRINSTNPFIGVFPDDLDDRLSRIDMSSIIKILEDTDSTGREIAHCEALLSITLFA